MILRRAIERQQELAKTVRGVYSESCHFAHTLEQHIERMNVLVWRNPRYQKLPDHAKAYIRGVDATMFNLLYSVPINYHSLENKIPSALVAIHIGPDGRKFGPNDDSWLEQDSAYKSSLKTEHVWEHRWRKGEYKPW